MRGLQPDDLIRVKYADFKRLQQVEHEYNRMKADHGRSLLLVDRLKKVIADYEKEGADERNGS